MFCGLVLELRVSQGAATPPHSPLFFIFLQPLWKERGAHAKVELSRSAAAEPGRSRLRLTFAPAFLAT